MVNRACTLLALSSALACMSSAQSVKLVRLTKTGVTVTVNSSVHGRDYVDYTVALKAGHRLTVGITSPLAEFNVLPPSSMEAMHNSSIGGGKFTGIVPDDGDYRVRVYLPTAAGRRGETSRFSLSMTRGGEALAPLSDSRDARVTGSRFHATGPVTCALPLFPDTKACEGKVVRRQRDSATVVLLAPSFRRTVLFREGKPIASDSPQKMSSRRSEDNTVVSFEGGETFTIPDALVLGG